ncbi:secretin N-terminal domain-containing protein [Burkholderia gladioli]|uniref:secretin N-terminal domain-containing protein n=1 Tax=Burkholderia gladioli TaxID=28095 RepID=UPI00163EB18C|nr:secretin N-terminal domain-containing protein [Burkholderia gladioli]
MKPITLIFPLIAAMAGGGCAGTYHRADDAAGTSPAQGIEALQRRQAESPRDIEAAQAAATGLQDYVRGETRQAETRAALGDYPAAAEHLSNALAHDPGNLQAEQLRGQLARRQQADADLARARQLSRSRPRQALDLVRGVLGEQPAHREARRLRDALLRDTKASRTARPQLDDALRKPVSLNFRSQPIGRIFEAISRVSGVNFVFDSEVQTDMPASLFARRTTAENAIELLLRTSQLERRVLDRHTLLVYPARPEKARDYREFAIRTFFLSHAEAKSVMAALRQMVKPKDIYVDERVNAIVLRDTPETIQVAERVVIGLDIPQSEVTLDVQVLEVNVNDSVDLGLQYPGKIQFSALGAGEEVGLTLGDLLRLNRDRIGVASESGALSMAIDMLQKQGKTRTLANPKIRVRNLEKANIRIGERVPIVTTTNGNGVVTESVSYQDVGLMLKVEPRVSLDDEVSVKVSLEVSNILSEQRTRSGLVAYSLGTRNADTLMTARNGQTQVLAGLIKRSEIESRAGLPWLSSLPVLGRLFGSDRTRNEETEIVLLITPHIERRLDLPEAAVTTFLSGTETRVTTEALSLAPAGAGPEPSPPKLHEPILAADVVDAEAREVDEDSEPGLVDRVQASEAGDEGKREAKDRKPAAGSDPSPTTGPGPAAGETVEHRGVGGMMRTRNTNDTRRDGARLPAPLRDGWQS